jgi:hypothetical protein
VKVKTAHGRQIDEAREVERALELGSALTDSVRRRTDDENPRELPLSMQFNLGESTVWFSNAHNNFAPFAGFMLGGLTRGKALNGKRR